MMKQSLRRIFDRWLPRGGFARSVSILAGGTALAQVLAVAASPILTRIYKPSEFGALQVFISLMALVVVAASGRYEVAILLPEDEQSAVDVLGVAILCVGLSTTICAGIVLICHYYWILPSSVLVLKGYLWLLPFSVLGGGVYQVLNYWAEQLQADCPIEVYPGRCTGYNATRRRPAHTRPAGVACWRCPGTNEWKQSIHTRPVARLC
jgi:hypothetical protein